MGIHFGNVALHWEKTSSKKSEAARTETAIIQTLESDKKFMQTGKDTFHVVMSHDEKALRYTIKKGDKGIPHSPNVIFAFKLMAESPNTLKQHIKKAIQRLSNRL